MKKYRGILASLLIAPTLLMSTISFTKTVEPQVLSLEFNPVSNDQAIGLFLASWAKGSELDKQNKDKDNIHTNYEVKYSLGSMNISWIMNLLINKDFFTKFYSHLHISFDLSYNTFNDHWSLKENGERDLYNPIKLNWTIFDKIDSFGKAIWSSPYNPNFDEGIMEVTLGGIWEGQNNFKMYVSFAGSLLRKEDRPGNNHADYVKLKNLNLVFDDKW